jgi:Ser/Thr protein kinase RdoA (MazF antagonist)
VHSFEAAHPVTYGPSYGDGLHLQVNTGEASVGVIDWGTVSRGPLLFDLALAAHAARRAEHVEVTELFASYLAAGPMQPVELEGLRHYEAVMWARSAKYFASPLEHQVLLGDPRPGANAESLARAFTALQRLLYT